VNAALQYTRRTIALVLAAVVLSACGTWRGVANVPLPGGPGTASNAYTVYVQMPDTLSLNVNSRVRVADVYVGTVRAIMIDNWVATLRITLDPTVKLPANATAKIGQTSLLGTQHVELAAPPNPSARPLRNGDTIPLRNSSAFPSTEQTLASIATVLRGGGIPNLEAIQNEVYNMLSDNSEQIRDFLTKLDTFTADLDAQSQNITRAITSTNRLVGIAADHAQTLDRVLTAVPPLIAHFASQRDLFADAIEALGRFADITGNTLKTARADLHENLRLLQRPLRELARSSPYLPQALQLLLTLPFTIDNVGKVVRGDYINLSGTFDLTLSTLDNSLLTGTRFSGALRALEQSWGRDPNTMLPDIRFTPNPNDAPGGPLVDRGD
jgi:phospholipid/cholesterol/gamma-HCH transport system substrate-binding protein